MRVMTIDSLNGLRGRGLGTTAIATALDQMDALLFEAEGLYTPLAEAADRGEIPLGDFEKLRHRFDELRTEANAVTAAAQAAGTSLAHDGAVEIASGIRQRTQVWIRDVRKTLGIGGLWMIGAVALAALVFGGAAVWAVGRK